MDHAFREYLFGVPIGGNTAIVQDDDAVGMLRGQVEVMQNRADRAAFLANEVACSRQRRLLMTEVEAGRGLVQQQGGRLCLTAVALELAQGAGELYPGALAARQRRLQPRRQMADIQRFHDRSGQATIGP